ncbi:hypothetical protein H1V43_07545 [Streptomyces sp. PSKA54]|uniref:Uncharacterized protein n=1 Tax=Streptomyces himalayensis subsp. aureolus TaxID=2758039 RepID=A0A7W2HEV7_9ACTN|nr:hypothetical protein [Streptomyces himalayensis]MBA4861240.1 hypothetical protein [Streptomyces himalayensis subsp. aureolus]
MPSVRASAGTVDTRRPIRRNARDHTARPWGQELIPLPERTPEAVRTALARVAPHRLDDMEQHKEQALATAIQDGKIGHLQAWLTH